MAYTFLALKVSDIPAETKLNVPTYSLGYFSNDGTWYLMPGYNEERKLVHEQTILLDWLQWEPDPATTLQVLLDGASELTKVELDQQRADPTSIWYINMDEE